MNLSYALMGKGERMRYKGNSWGYLIALTAFSTLAMLGIWKLIEVIVFGAPLVCLR